MNIRQNTKHKRFVPRTNENKLPNQLFNDCLKLFVVVVFIAIAIMPSVFSTYEQESNLYNITYIED